MIDTIGKQHDVNFMTSISSPQGISGLDVMEGLELLLVKDYDSQLQSMAKSMKESIDIKSSYRDYINKLKGFLMREPHKLDGRDGKYVTLQKTSVNDPSKTNEYKMVTNPQDYSINEKGEVFNYGSADITYISPTKTNLNLDGTVESYEINTNSIEKMIEQYNSKLDTLNEQGEIVSLQLQSLTNKRKIAFETLSNIISKSHDSINTIIRNIK